MALLRGRDTEFAPLHPDQGSGTFEHGRTFVGRDDIGTAGRYLQDEASPGTRCETNEWQRCDARVHELMEPLSASLCSGS